jgi:hypothetical protein
MLETQLKELDPEKIRIFGKLTDDSLPIKDGGITKEKIKLIFEKFKIRR